MSKKILIYGGSSLISKELINIFSNIKSSRSIKSNIGSGSTEVSIIAANLFIKQLSSIEFSLNNKLSINSDVIRFIRGDSNFQFKYQIANFFKGKKQKKIAIGMGYSSKSNLGFPGSA